MFLALLSDALPDVVQFGKTKTNKRSDKKRTILFLQDDKCGSMEAVLYLFHRWALVGDRQEFTRMECSASSWPYLYGKCVSSKFIFFQSSGYFFYWLGDKWTTPSRKRGAVKALKPWIKKSKQYLTLLIVPPKWCFENSSVQALVSHSRYDLVEISGSNSLTLFQFLPSRVIREQVIVRKYTISTPRDAVSAPSMRSPG